MMIEKIVACIDDSPSAKSVCDWSAYFSQVHDANVHLLHVIEKVDAHDTQDYSGKLGFNSRESLLNELVELDAKRAKIELEQGKIMLEHALSRVSERTKQPITSLQRHDDLLPAVQSQLGGKSLLVLGKQGLSGDPLGSHLERITRQITQPIFVATKDEFEPPKKLMLAYDGKEISKKALSFLAHSHLSDLLKIHVVMIGDFTQDELNIPSLTFVEAGKEAETKRYPAPENRKALTDTLLEHAKIHDIDILAIGAYGNSALKRLFLGSTTLDTLERAQIPVLLLR